MIWWWYKRLVYFFAPSGITGLPVVADRLTNPIRWNKLFAQDVFSRSTTFRFLSSLFAIRACVIAIATTVFTTPPFFGIACRYFMTFSSISDPNRSGLPRLTFVKLVRPCSYFFRWSWTVLSPSEYFRAAREFLWIEAYLSIISISSLVDLTYFLFFLGRLRLKLRQLQIPQSHPNFVLWYLSCGSRTCKTRWKVVQTEASFLLHIKEFAHLMLIL